MGKRSRPGLNRTSEIRCKNRSSSFDFMKYPVGTNYFKADEGRHNLLIIPYIIKTKNHPLVVKGKAKVGGDDYVLIVEVHKNVGPENVNVICLQKNFNKPCPLCEEGLKTSSRAVYNVINADTPEKGLYVFSTSDFLFQEPLEKELKEASTGGEYLPFCDPEEGYIVSFRGDKAYANGIKFIEFASFKFVERDKELNRLYEKERWEDKALSLDEYMVILSYDEMKNILENREYDDEDENQEEEIEDNEKDGVSEDERRERRRKRREKEESKTKENDCPYGFKFGIDTDTKKECDKCDEWEKCDKKCRESEK